MRGTRDVVCPAWCVTDDCHGEHWASPGGEAWPGIVATAYPPDGHHTLVPHPTWGEVDGLEPAVGLWLHGELDVTIDLTPDEATALARQLLAAVGAVR